MVSGCASVQTKAAAQQTPITAFSWSCAETCIAAVGKDLGGAIETPVRNNLATTQTSQQCVIIFLLGPYSLNSNFVFFWGENRLPEHVLRSHLAGRRSSQTNMKPASQQKQNSYLCISISVFENVNTQQLQCGTNLFAYYTTFKSSRHKMYKSKLRYDFLTGRLCHQAKSKHSHLLCRCARQRY